MAYLQALRESLGHYISPNAGNSKRLPIISASSPDMLKEWLDRDPMNPTRLTHEWVKTHSPGKNRRKSPTSGVKDGRITKHRHTTPSSTTKSTKPRVRFLDRLMPSIIQQKHDEKALEDIEGTTLVRDESYSSDSAMKEEGFSEIEDFEGDTTLIPEEIERDLTKTEIKGGHILDMNNERIKQWTKEEIWLFEKLNKRGYEPLVDGTWAMDFRTLPDQLFSLDDPRVLITAASWNKYNASKALFTLFNAGPRVRDRLAFSLTPEKPIHRAVIDYYKWTLIDASLNRTPHIPSLTIAAAMPAESVESVVSRATDQLYDLGRRYRAKWPPIPKEGGHRRHELPTLFGIVIKYTVVAFVTYDSNVEGKPIRTIGNFNFKENGQDVWHALAISILMIRARNYLMGLRDEGEIGGQLEPVQDDPDA